MLKELRPAIVIFAALTIVTGLIYPLVMTAVAQALFPDQAHGSLIRLGDRVVGSGLIGQDFEADNYFHGRPSATTATDPKDASKTVPAPYNASNSAGSNLGPTSKVLADRVRRDVAALKVQNPSAPVPVDLVTTSGSGLDPDISPQAARFQAARVAKARNLPEAEIEALIDSRIEGRDIGVLGEPRVNVLKLNLALDRMAASRQPR